MNRRLRQKKFNLDNFNKNFEKKIKEKLKKEKNITNKNKYIFNQDLKDDEVFNDVNKLSIEDIVLEIRDIFYISLKLISKKKNPINYIMSSQKRKYCSSILIIILGCLLLLLSTLMMEKSL